MARARSARLERAEIDQARRHGGGQGLVAQQVAVEVGAGGEHDRAGAGAGRVEQEVDEAGDVGLGLGWVSAGMVQGLGVELLPLVDVEQQPIGAALLLGRQQAADVRGEQASGSARNRATCRSVRSVASSGGRSAAVAGRRRGPGRAAARHPGAG